MRLGLVTPEQLSAAMERQRALGRPLGEVLVTDRVITPEQLQTALAARLGVEPFDISAGVDPSALAMIDERTARRYEAAPIRQDPDGRLVVAMTDPSNIFALDDLRILTRREIRPVLATKEDLGRVLGSATRIDQVVADLVGQADEAGGRGAEPDVADIIPTESDAPVVRLVNSLLARAVDERASDVHFEPQAKEMMVRMRVDGVLKTVASVPYRLANGVSSRIKVMANLDIAEKRLPQDGRFGLSISGRGLDLRVATLPTVYGEKVVIRVLDKSNVMMELADLGFANDLLERYRSCWSRPHGAVLVTGPTGSGKSTTLYATLNQLNSVERNVITVEDPVEYRLAGINQVQVNPKAGLSFAAGLRSILRCDPDVVMIGEVRDAETAKIAIESALTGHLVLATLHTNDAAAALTRLDEMGVEPFLFASAVTGILAQRLARRLCRHCRREGRVNHTTLATLIDPRRLPRTLPDPCPVFHAVGCANCGGTGYSGRVGVYEMLVMSETIARMVVEGTTSDAITAQAMSEGMRTLREDGLVKVLRGETTLEELARAVG